MGKGRGSASARTEVFTFQHELRKTIAMRTLALVGILNFSLFMTSAIVQNWGYVDNWMDEFGQNGTLRLGAFEVCKLDYDSQPDRCYGYSSKRGLSATTYYSDYFISIYRSPTDDECNNAFSVDESGGSTDFCHYRRSIAAFMSLGCITAFATMILSLFVLFYRDDEQYEGICFACYVTTTLLTVIPWSIWISFLDRWIDARLSDLPVSTPASPGQGNFDIEQGLSAQLCIVAWVLSFAMCFVAGYKLWFTVHTGVFEDDMNPVTDDEARSILGDIKDTLQDMEDKIEQIKLFRSQREVQPAAAPTAQVMSGTSNDALAQPQQHQQQQQTQQIPVQESTAQGSYVNHEIGGIVSEQQQQPQASYVNHSINGQQQQTGYVNHQLGAQHAQEHQNFLQQQPSAVYDTTSQGQLQQQELYHEPEGHQVQVPEPDYLQNEPLPPPPAPGMMQGSVTKHQTLMPPLQQQLAWERIAATGGEEV